MSASLGNDVKAKKLDELKNMEREVLSFVQASITNMQNDKNPELQKYTSETLNVVGKLLNLIKDFSLMLFEGVKENEKRNETLEKELSTLKSQKTAKTRK